MIQLLYTILDNDSYIFTIIYSFIHYSFNRTINDVYSFIQFFIYIIHFSSKVLLAREETWVDRNIKPLALPIITCAALLMVRKYFLGKKWINRVNWKVLLFRLTLQTGRIVVKSEIVYPVKKNIYIYQELIKLIYFLL